jgi:hypothetical protein
MVAQHHVSPTDQRPNRTAEPNSRAVLEGVINHLQDDWLHWLLLAEFAYNNSLCSLTGLTPFDVERAYHPDMSERMRWVPANDSVPYIFNARARAQWV